MGRKVLVITLLLLLLVATPARADSAKVSDISKQLICQCGCTLTLANCTHGECMSRDAMLTLIEQKITQGQSEEQIVQFFVAQYGEQVLASPPKRGFNLVAWVLPFVAILAGAGVIYIALRVWVERGQLSRGGATSQEDETDEKYQQRLELELKEFGERGFR